MVRLISWGSNSPDFPELEFVEEPGLSPSRSNPTDYGERRIIAITGGSSNPQIRNPSAIHALRQPSLEIN